MSNAYLILGLQKGPEVIRWIVDHADESIWDQKTDPERFSFREVIAHLADWEPITLGRMRQAKENPGSTLEVWDEVQRAIDMDYASLDPRAELARWIELRAITLAFLQEEAPGYWSNSVTHPERGEVTLSDIANMDVGHDMYHVEQLLAFMP